MGAEYRISRSTQCRSSGATKVRLLCRPAWDMSSSGSFRVLRAVAWLLDNMPIAESVPYIASWTNHYTAKKPIHPSTLSPVLRGHILASPNESASRRCQSKHLYMRHTCNQGLRNNLMLLQTKQCTKDAKYPKGYVGTASAVGILVESVAREQLGIG
jgi:hypothetical protein